MHDFTTWGITSWSRDIQADLKANAETAYERASYDYVPEDRATAEAATQTGALAYLQHVLKHTYELTAQYVEKAVLTDGLHADDIAAGLTEHGIDGLTGDKLREMFPQLIALEQRLSWLRDNATDYLPLLYAVSRMVHERPILVDTWRKEQAGNTHGLLRATLHDATWDQTQESLGQVEAWILGQYAPHNQPWLMDVNTELIEPGPARAAAEKLIGMAREYYAIGRAADSPLCDGAVAAGDSGTYVEPLEQLQRDVAGALQPVEPRTTQSW